MTEARLKEIVNLTYVLVDMADFYCTEIETAFKRNKNYRHDDKHSIRQMKLHASKLVRSVDKTLKTLERQEEYGATSDFFRTVFEALGKTTNQEEEQKILASIKLIVKPKKELPCTTSSQVTL